MIDASDMAVDEQFMSLKVFSAVLMDGAARSWLIHRHVLCGDATHPCLGLT